MQIRAVFLDFGGVYYTDGFRDGLFTLAERFGQDKERFYAQAVDSIFATGYVMGDSPERVFWQDLAGRCGLTENLYPGRQDILDSFKPLKGMADLVRELRQNLPVALISDQTNWLYELNARDSMLREFDDVINSYEEGFSKRDPEIFRVACQRMDIFPEEGIFFDDSEANVRMAVEFGMAAHLFEGPVQTRQTLISRGLLQGDKGRKKGPGSE